jgi:hypothetical protein
MIGLTLVLLFPSGGGAEPASGTLYVASRADTPFRCQVRPPTGEASSGGLQGKFDKRPGVPWPQRESLKIEGLDIKERHLVAVLDAHGKPVESVWFRFYGSNHLCLLPRYWLRRMKALFELANSRGCETLNALFGVAYDRTTLTPDPQLGNFGQPIERRKAVGSERLRNFYVSRFDTPALQPRAPVSITASFCFVPNVFNNYGNLFLARSEPLGHH